MEDSRLSLRFKGPFVLAGSDAPLIFSDSVAQEAGIYLWAVPYVGGGLVVTYVGETHSAFGQRMKEHAIQTLGGNYRVSDPDLLRQGVDRVLWNGLWRSGTRDRLPEYLERFVELAPVIRRQLMSLRVLIAPLQTETRVRRRIEATIANHIKRQAPPASALLPRDVRYHGRREPEEAIFVHVSSDVEVLGLPAALEA